MDRAIVYPGQIPLDTDFLSTQKNSLLGIGFLADTVLGPSVLFDGLPCQPTVPASMSVQVLPGTVYTAQPTDAITFGSLGSDPFRQTVKQGILRDASVLTLVAPVTSGHAINYLVQAAFSEVESDPIVLPYYNSTNPAQPYSGPENSGVAQFTARKGRLLVNAKAGTSAVSGAQTTPAADPGYTGLYVITVAFGQTTITSGNITQIPTAPFLPAKLPVIPAGVRNGLWTYAVDSGAADAMLASVYPAPTAYVAGMGLRVKVAAANTGPTTISVNGLGAVAVVRSDGANLQAGDLAVGAIVDIVYDGSKFQIVNSTGLTVIQSVGGGVDVYQGKLLGIESIRSLVAGANITLTLVESPASSGRFGISIAAAAGGGGGSVNITNIGAGIQIYKGLNGTDHELRSVQGDGLLTAALGGTGSNEVRVRMAQAAGARLLMREPNSTGDPAFVKISATTLQAAPVGADKILMERDASGNIEHTTIDAIRGGVGVWEVAAAVSISVAVAELELLFTADKYVQLLLMMEDVDCTLPSTSAVPVLEAAIMNDSTVLARAPMVGGIGVVTPSMSGFTTDLRNISGSLEWNLSGLGSRMVHMKKIDLVGGDMTGTQADRTAYSDRELWGVDYQGPGAGLFGVQAFSLIPVGIGSNTFIGPSVPAGASPPNKLRIRPRKFTSLYNDTSLAGTIDIGGRFTLYGLKRSAA